VKISGAGFEPTIFAVIWVRQFSRDRGSIDEAEARQIENKAEERPR